MSPRRAFPVLQYLAAAGTFLWTAGSLRAELRCPEPAVDAGVVRVGTLLAYRFPLVNAGLEAVEITDVRASCGCLAPRLAQRRYQPGEQGSLLLEVNTLSQPAGPRTWSVRLRYQSGAASGETTLALAARLLAEIRVQPAALVVLVDRAAAPEVTVTDLRPQPLTITRVEASSPGLHPRLQEPSRDAEGHLARKVILEVAADYPEGRHEETLHLYTDDPGYPELRVPVTVHKRAEERLAAVPAEVTLTAPPGQPFPSRIVLVRDRRNEPVKILRVTADHPALVCHWAAGPNALAAVRIRVDRTRLPAGGLDSAVHVQVAEPVRRTLTIPVHCSEQKK